jgi:DNA-directed RNA polymerase specialized sigma24 family protein
MQTQLQSVDERVIPYAPVIGFGDTFAKEMQNLYLLSFLLTADKDKAEQCFISGLGEWTEGISAFMERSRLWARRTIIEQAIQMVRPAPLDSDDWSHIGINDPVGAQENLFAAIVSLSPFERFVFVMSVLEGQSDGDCLSLLNCSRREIEIARELAIRFLITTDPGDDRFQKSFQAWRIFTLPR